MSKILNAFDQLILDAGEALSNKLLRSASTVKWYRVYWRCNLPLASYIQN